jgi:hypothetical protein
MGIIAKKGIKMRRVVQQTGGEALYGSSFLIK